MSAKFFIIAGEPSGDYIGAQLIYHLKKIDPEFKFYGIGGPLMGKEGLRSLFPMKKISIIGLAEILPHILKLINLINQTAKAIEDIKPNSLITVDSPGFCYRVVKKVRKTCRHEMKIINYVAPSVWAYKENRVHKVADLYDHQLLILPNEKSYFDAIDFPSTYVGFPALEKPIFVNEANIDLYQKYSIKNKLLITLMPGSRRGEIKRHIPILKKALELLLNKISHFSIFIPTFREFEEELRSSFNSYDCIISCEDKTKAELLSIANFGIIKSGTATVDMMHNLIPSIVIYKVSPISALLIKFFIKTKFFALPNIILNQEVMPEFIQSYCTAENISDALHQLISSQSKQEKQRTMFKQALNKLCLGNQRSPSENAAHKILKIISYK